MNNPNTPSGKKLLKEKEGYLLSEEDNVYRYFQPAFKQTLDHYLKCFVAFNEAYLGTGVDPVLMPGLPYSLNNRFWKERQNDLRRIEEEIRPKSEVLEIGSWNGWLANALAEKEHSVTAIDYFLDASNGLKARTHYPNAAWTSLHMDVDDIDLLDVQFDLIVFNRSISYYSDFEGLIHKAQTLLKEGGKLILTGLNAVSNYDGANSFYEQTAEVFQENYEISMEIKPNSKKMLTNDDLKLLTKRSFELRRNGGLLAYTLKKFVVQKSSRSYTAIYTNVKS
jgi:2-polyprenyl-3-methyl-5-hydroxy-6-metoxy-1,4-benzoquinol methylase